MMRPAPQRTAWHYVGCGCVAAAILGALICGGLIFFGAQWGEGVKTAITDPAAREAQARKLLRYDELPEGYYPGFSLSMPFIVDLVILGDRELPADFQGQNAEEESFDERGFVYLEANSFVRGGRGEFDTDIDFRPERELATGEVTAGGAEVTYTASYGQIAVAGGTRPSVAAEILFDCPDDSRYRQALWFTAAPEGITSQAAADEPPLTGTPADEGALRAFLDHFKFCE